MYRTGGVGSKGEKEIKCYENSSSRPRSQLVGVIVHLVRCFLYGLHNHQLYLFSFQVLAKITSGAAMKKIKRERKRVGRGKDRNPGDYKLQAKTFIQHQLLI